MAQRSVARIWSASKQGSSQSSIGVSVLWAGGELRFYAAIATAAAESRECVNEMAISVSSAPAGR